METIYSHKGKTIYRIVEFYKGLSPDIEGRHINEIFDYNYEQLERIHNYIQWIFPLNEPSLFHENVPVLTNEEINELKNNKVIKDNRVV